MDTAYIWQQKVHCEYGQPKTAKIKNNHDAIDKKMKGDTLTHASATLAPSSFLNLCTMRKQLG